MTSKTSTLLFLLLFFFFKQIEAIDTSNVYFKTLIQQKGFLYGKSLINIDATQKININFAELNVGFDLKYGLSVVAVTLDGKLKLKQRFEEIFLNLNEV